MYIILTCLLVGQRGKGYPLRSNYLIILGVLGILKGQLTCLAMAWVPFSKADTTPDPVNII